MTEAEIAAEKLRIYRRFSRPKVFVTVDIVRVTNLLGETHKRISEIERKYGEQGWMEDVSDEDNLELLKLYKHTGCLNSTRNALKILHTKGKK